MTGESCVGNIVTYVSSDTTNNPPTTNNSPYDFGTVTLKKGDTGPAVLAVQKFLNDKFHLGLKLDGVLGSKTIAIMEKLQKDNGLTPDGVIGQKTKDLMMNAVN
jgi:peptidoglycan hydrolase-like protein with peptidoglycan-binding domain